MPAPTGNQYALNNEGGRPSSYRHEYAHYAYCLIIAGRDKIWMIAFVIGVTCEDVINWIENIDEFADAIERGYNDQLAYEQEKADRKAKRRAIRATAQARKKANEYAKARLESNIQFKIRNNFSSLLRHHLNSKNRQHVFDVVGYSCGELMAHLEARFKEGMSWDNYGEWHIDHIKPASWFSYDTQECPGFRECWSLDNLQPLWATENAKKSNRYEG